MCLKPLHAGDAVWVPARMKLVIELEYLVRESQSGSYKYRRRVPERLRPTVGKPEIIDSLRTKDRSVAL